MGDERVVRRPLFCFEDLGDSRFIKNIGAEPVNRLGRKRYDAAGTDAFGGIVGVIGQDRLHRKSGLKAKYQLSAQISRESNNRLSAPPLRDGGNFSFSESASSSISLFSLRLHFS